MTPAFLLSLMLAAAAPPPAASAELEDAKQLYRDAAFAEATLKLQAAIELLRPRGDKSLERARLADAYLYLCLAHLGLNEWGEARQALKELVRLAPTRRLDPEVYAPKVLELFAEVKREMDAAAPAPAAPRSGSPARWLAGGAAAAAGAGAVVLATHDGSTGPTIVPTLTLNGELGGTFSCTGGLFFRLAASNPTDRSVRVDRFNLTFSSSSARCASHGAPVFGDSIEIRTLAPGSTDVTLRRMDLQGDLCRPPNGSAEGCGWQANVVLQTEIGNFGRDLQFETVP